jgi:hypothetical protein
LSVEDQLSLIELQYQAAYKMVARIPSNAYRTDDDINEAIKAVLTFQRNIELLYEDIAKLSDDKTQYYIERCHKNVVSIRLSIRGASGYQGVLDDLDSAAYSPAYTKFRNIRSDMYGIIEDVRMIYSLRIYPVEEKMALKSMLTDYGFLEVTKCLDEAEDNMVNKHNKDCIDRSREALEKTASSMLTAEKKTPSGSFSTDIGTISNMGIIDKETKRLTEATYSYLSEKGAHGRAGEVTPGDAHYAMKETYMRIDILLKKYTTFHAIKK